MMRMIIITIIIRIMIKIIVTIRLLALMILIILIIMICPLSRIHEGKRLGKSGKGVRKGIRCC